MNPSMFYEKYINCNTSLIWTKKFLDKLPKEGKNPLAVNEDCYDFFVFCRIKPDSKSIFDPSMLDKKINLQAFKDIANHQHWVLDVPGYITRQNLIRLIKDNFVLPKGGKLNGKTIMDADNYYCQAGDLWSIEYLLEVLKGKIPKDFIKQITE